MLLDRLVRDLYGESNPDYATVDIFTKFRAFYPFITGESFGNSLNLVDTSLYSISWNGSPTHTLNGVQMNGVNQYGGLSINASTDLDLYSKCAGMYHSSHIATGNPWYWGAYDGNLFGLRVTTGEADAIGVNNYQGIYPTKTIGKMHAVDISSNSVAKLYNEGVLIESFSPGSAAPNTEMLIGGINIAKAAVTMQTFFVGSSLTDSEHLALFNALEAYNSGLGR